MVELEQKVKEPGTGSVVGWARDLLVAFIASMVIIFCLYQPVRVEGTSMLPVLFWKTRTVLVTDQQRLPIRVGWNAGRASMGSIASDGWLYSAIRTTATKSYIKRVIALPGDTLRIDHGRVIS